MNDNTISLVKVNQNQIISLSKGVQKAYVKLKWFNKRDNKEVDADLSAMCLGSDGKMLNGVVQNLLFFNTQTLNKDEQMILHGGALTHSGDDLGDSQADDGASEEEIAVTFGDLPASVSEILFFSTIYTDPGERVDVDFSDARDASVLVSDHNKKGLISYDIAKNFGSDNSIIICSFKRVVNKWEFKALGTSSKDEISDILKKYCNNVKFQ